LEPDFGTALGHVGDAAEAATDAEKLPTAYRDRWLAWVDRCVTVSEDCVAVAERRSGGDPGEPGDAGVGPTARPTSSATSSSSRSAWRSSGMGL
jgi:hypothetical protein